MGRKTTKLGKVPVLYSVVRCVLKTSSVGFELRCGKPEGMLASMRILPWLLACLVFTLSAGWTSVSGAQEGQWEAEGPGHSEQGPDEHSGDESNSEEQRQALDQFEPELNPYGSWRHDARFGRVWVPSRSVVGRGFVPYQTGGHWTMTAHDDWLWQSDYPFGWVAFHYGRWAVLNSGVWGWIPGYRYSPAWVDFRVGVNGYVGWGPRAPRYGWRRSGYWALSGPVITPFVFCPTRHVFASRLGRHVLTDRARIRRYSRQSRYYGARRSVRGRRVYGPTLRVAGVSRSAAPRRRIKMKSQRRRKARRASRGRASKGRATKARTSRGRATKPRKSRGRATRSKASRGKATRGRAAKAGRRNTARRAKAKPKQRGRNTQRQKATKRQPKKKAARAKKTRPAKAKRGGNNRAASKRRSSPSRGKGGAGRGGGGRKSRGSSGRRSR